jgi:hypothetical protein
MILVAFAAFGHLVMLSGQTALRVANVIVNVSASNGPVVAP